MIFRYLIVLLYSSFLFANSNCLVDNKKTPLWVCEKSIYDLKYNTAIGIATKNNLPFKIIKKLAIADARTNLVETIKVKVKSELYMKTSSITHNNKEIVAKEIVDTIHTVAKEKISNYRVLEVWQSTSSLYVLIGIPLKI